MAAPQKTPYQGKNRCLGLFTCNFGHRWRSQYSWANCGQRCGECLTRKFGKSWKDITKEEALAVEYTSPYSQGPLEDREIYLFCEKCYYEEEAMFPKKRKCPTPKCQGFLVPWNYLRCPHCGYKHEWAEDRKTAKRLQFVCNEYAEEGKGCESVIGLEEGAETGATGPHPYPLCEKCHGLGHKCTGHGRRKKRKNKRSTASDVGSVGAPSAAAPSVGAASAAAPSVGASGDMQRCAKAAPGVLPNGDVNNNNNEVSPQIEAQSTSKKRNKSRSRRKSSGKQMTGDDVVNELVQIMEKL